MADSLFEKLTLVASDLTLDVLRNYHNCIPLRQNDDLATNCSKITKNDGEIAFFDAVILYNKYRAFMPWPGIHLHNGLKIKSMRLHSACRAFESGKIIEVTKDYIVVGCTLGSLRIYKVQPESKNEMDIVSYCNGKRLKVDDYLS